MTQTSTSPDRTPGQQFAAAARYYLSIGARTRRWRGQSDLHAEVIEATLHAGTPGYHPEHIGKPLAAGIGAALGWEKHIAGYRANGTVVAEVNAMTPWQFTKMLGDMIDAGVENTYQAEQFFRAMRRADAA